MEPTDIIKDLIERYPVLSYSREDIHTAFQLLCRSYENNGKLLVCGNGGSASDSEHIVGELMKSFSRKRPLPMDLRNNLLKVSKDKGAYLVDHLEGALTAISLTCHSALCTAIANDTDPSLIFAQQVVGYGKKEDVIIGISTSGNAINVYHAILTAKSLGLSTIGLTGRTGGNLSGICDVVIRVDATKTPIVQELHQPVYHALCNMLEEYFFS